MLSLTRLYNIGHGPSSSHTMGPIHAVEDFLSFYPALASYQVILLGSLALTGKGHLTDQAVINAFAGRKVEVIFDYFQDLVHPNTMVILGFDKNEQVVDSFLYTSIGGGTITRNGLLLELDTKVYPFKDFTAIKKYCLEENISLPTLVRRCENQAGIEIERYLTKVWEQMKKTIQRGLKTEGVLPGKLALTRKAPHLHRLQIPNEGVEARKERHIFAYAYATAEENAAGGIVVTAPTCGSSGVLPAVLYDQHVRAGVSNAKIIEALMVAGVIGNTVKTNGSISGAECGCQAEIGVAGAMAASALAYISDLSIGQIEYAAEVMMEHHLGLTCDPVFGYVQIPCIERNAVVAVQAASVVLLARHLYGSHRVSFDQMVVTMMETGRDMHVNYRETAIGGLAKTLGEDYQKDK
ncbi:MAG: L-serine ammonia-lyase, iron-sulfur-dependent, subunit alpha [Bacilli bacterium]|jgi:L-serine dehydratase